MKIWVNGTVCDESEAVVSVYDHGFLYGIGLFETFRTYRGKVFMLSEHLERLRGGCEALGIPLSSAEDTLGERIVELLEANGLEEAYFRYTVTAGTHQLGLTDQPYAEPNEVLYIKPLPPFDAKLYEQGKPLQLLKLRRNTPEAEIRYKSLHFMNNMLAKKELRQYPWSVGAEGLFLDAHGRLAEGIVSNLFFIKNGLCCTPHVHTGILPGITRRTILTLAALEGLDTEEGNYSWEQLLEADEVFVTNSIQEVVPISLLADTAGKLTTIGSGGAGGWTQQLLAAYRKLAWRFE